MPPPFFPPGIATGFPFGYNRLFMEEASAETLTAATALPAVSPLSVHPPGRSWRRALRWASELVTVFVGVYAAFMLNSYQAHRQERQRRAQVLAWVEGVYSSMLADMNEGEADNRKKGEAFKRRVDAGETPALHLFDFRSDYNPADFTSLLQSGGFDLLEIETVRDIREVEGTLRQRVEVIRHDQQLCDNLILPNLEKDPRFYYDASARKLRPAYAWYGDYFDSQAEFYREMRGELGKVLAQLRLERQHAR